MTLLVIHALATFTMIGVIWFVQLVAYPQFAHIDDASFLRYHAFHMRWTTVVVLPPMLIELTTTIWLTWQSPTMLMWIGVGLLAVVWLDTFGLEVPLHEKLKLGKNDRYITQLIRFNWPRTVAWTARGVLVGYLLASK